MKIIRHEIKIINYINFSIEGVKYKGSEYERVEYEGGVGDIYTKHIYIYIVINHNRYCTIYVYSYIVFFISITSINIVRIY